jgi:hypothetical protein
MAPRDPQDILAQLGRTTLKIDSFFLRKTGFVANQTVLKLGEFNVNCVPASFAFPDARFLAVLAPTEISLFSKFKEGLHVLVLSVDDPDGPGVKRFHLRVGVDDFVPVPDRKNVCQIVLKVKSAPPDFLGLLGDFIEMIEQRRLEWEEWGAEPIEANPDALRAAGLAASVKLVIGSAQSDASITAFHTKAIKLAPPGPADSAAQLRVVLRAQAVTLEGRLEGGDFVPEFSHDWLEAVEHARLQRDLRSRARTDA